MNTREVYTAPVAEIFALYKEVNLLSTLSVQSGFYEDDWTWEEDDL